MIKPLIFLFFSLFIILAASAQAQDISQLMGAWGEGKIDSQNNVVKLGPRMGGPVGFSLESDSVFPIPRDLIVASVVVIMAFGR